MFSLEDTKEGGHLDIKAVVKGLLSTYRSRYLISDKAGEFNYMNLRLLKSGSILDAEDTKSIYGL